MIILVGFASLFCVRIHRIYRVSFSILANDLVVAVSMNCLLFGSDLVRLYLLKEKFYWYIQNGTTKEALRAS